MSISHKGVWHWEYIPTRGLADAYRIGDEDDDVVYSVSTEAQSRRLVEEHNNQLKLQIEKEESK